MKVDLRTQHRRQLEQLVASLKGNTQRIRIKKRTVSNLFRYDGRSQQSSRQVDLRRFNQPLYLDTDNQTLEVQGLATFESIVDFTLPMGFLPTVTPELKHITIGGATVGIGIETNSFRYGFVHDGLLEADVLLPDGRIVTCSPDNDYADLSYGLPNSYGTLGYILRAKIRLRRAKSYVRLQTKEFADSAALLSAMKAATSEPANDYIESLLYTKTKLYLTTGQEVDRADTVTSIYGPTIFYKEISRPNELWLATKDYIFRYDPEWFWAIPESRMYQAFRRYTPKALRNSAFYTRYAARQKSLATLLPFLKFEDEGLEQLIQDWEVPWPQANALLDFALDTFDLDGRPLMAAPVKTPAQATCYPMQKNALYFNLGSYSFVKTKPGQPRYYNTKVTDDFCFGHDGIKMLYSTTFLSEAEFNRVYNGDAYAKLKHKYDPNELLPTLYQKAVQAH